MPNNTCSDLNIRLSIFRFIKQIADNYTLTTFFNDPRTQDDETQMASLAKYLWVSTELDADDDCLLHQLVSFHLYSRQQVLEPLTEYNDTPMGWLRLMTRQLRWDLRHTTTAFNLVGLYDYETLCTPTNIQDFQQTGNYTKIQATLTGTPALIPGTGFYVTNGAGPQVFKQEEPRRMAWSLIFRHFAPENMIWGPRG